MATRTPRSTALVEVTQLATTIVRLPGASCAACTEPLQLGARAAVVGGMLVHVRPQCLPKQQRRR
jgi:hypothetical protein